MTHLPITWRWRLAAMCDGAASVSLRPLRTMDAALARHWQVAGVRACITKQSVENASAAEYRDRTIGMCLVTLCVLAGLVGGAVLATVFNKDNLAVVVILLLGGMWPFMQAFGEPIGERLRAGRAKD